MTVCNTQTIFQDSQKGFQFFFFVLLFFMAVNGSKALSIPTMDRILINIIASISIEVNRKMMKFQFWLNCPFDTCKILVYPGQISNKEQIGEIQLRYCAACHPSEL